MNAAAFEAWMAREGIVRIFRDPTEGWCNVRMAGGILGTGTTFEEALENARRDRDAQREQPRRAA